MSEEQLTMLEIQQRDISADIMWVSLGAAVGAAPATFEALTSYAKEEAYVFSSAYLAQMAIFLVAVGALIVSGWLYISRSKDQKTLIEKIRAQKKDGKSKP